MVAQGGGALSEDGVGVAFELGDEGVPLLGKVLGERGDRGQADVAPRAYEQVAEVGPPGRALAREGAGGPAQERDAVGASFAGPGGDERVEADDVAALRG